MLRPLFLLSPIVLLACTDGDDTGSKTDDTGGPAGTPPTVVINEILSSNVATNADDLGEYDDWVELYNPGTEPADLAGVYLSDDPAFPTAWPFPDGTTLAPGDFLLVWCDDGTGTQGLHATFKLNVTGDQVVLSWVDGGADPVELDWVQFGKQQSDLSAARIPDGGDTWEPAATPTPGASNG